MSFGRKLPVLLKIPLKTFKELHRWRASNLLRYPVCVWVPAPSCQGPLCQPRDRARLGPSSAVLKSSGSCSERPLGTACIVPHELNYRLGWGEEKKNLNKMLLICPSRDVTDLPGANSVYEVKYMPRGFPECIQKVHPLSSWRNKWVQSHRNWHLLGLSDFLTLLVDFTVGVGPKFSAKGPCSGGCTLPGICTFAVSDKFIFVVAICEGFS